MRLIKLFLPLADKDGRSFPSKHYERIKMELTEKFGGVTVFSNAPAEGVWAEGEGVEYDQIIVFEVVAKTLSRRWWQEYRNGLEKLFRQDQIMMQVHTVEIL